VPLRLVVRPSRAGLRGHIAGVGLVAGDAGRVHRLLLSGQRRNAREPESGIGRLASRTSPSLSIRVTPVDAGSSWPRRCRSPRHRRRCRRSPPARLRSISRAKRNRPHRHDRSGAYEQRHALERRGKVHTAAARLVVGDGSDEERLAEKILVVALARQRVGGEFHGQPRRCWRNWVPPRPCSPDADCPDRRGLWPSAPFRRRSSDGISAKPES
jgi:hypothetical protein